MFVPLLTYNANIFTEMNAKWSVVFFSHLRVFVCVVGEMKVVLGRPKLVNEYYVVFLFSTNVKSISGATNGNNSSVIL